MSDARLLRVLEQKQPHHTLGWSQSQILRLLDAVIAHCQLCPEAAELHLDPRSGIYIVRGHIAAANSARRETAFEGDQVIERLRDGDERKFRSHEEFFRFLDPQDARRRGRSNRSTGGGGCGRQWCGKCREELIHRDHRKSYESASALGQIIWREGPKNISAADIDFASLKLLDGAEQRRVA